MRDKEQLKETAHKVLDVVTRIGSAAMVAHPVVIALGVMTFAQVSRLFMTTLSKEDILFSNLYQDTRNLAIGAVVIPVVAPTLQLLGSMLAK